MRLLLIFSALSLAACAHQFTYTKLNDPPHALTPRKADDVEVFKQQPPGREYVEIGLIETKKPVFDRDAEISPGAIERFRVKAAELGCEFIVLEGKTPVNAAPPSPSRYRAACVVYK